MPRKSSSSSGKSRDDWKSKFVNVALSPNDENEIREFIAAKGSSSLGDLVAEIVGNGGSIKFTHSKNDGSVFATIATDSLHGDYGGYMFGVRYANLPGLVAIADWFYTTRLLSDRGLAYLPDTLDDWLNLA